MAARLQFSSSWCWALGAAGLVFAARLHEIHLHTGDVPLNDQWQIEAADIIAPWLGGTLRPGMFFNPHFEHVPVWTRLLAWLEVVVTGRWDPFVQTTVNALLLSGFIALAVQWIADHLLPLAALAVTALLMFGASQPHTWENITWGFQSQFPLALLCLFLHVRGSFAHAPGTRGWWWAQGAGLAGLFTLASMWLAPLAVVLTALWTDPRGPRRRLVPLATAGLGLAIIALIRAHGPPDQAFVQTAGAALRFLYAGLDLLGWPAGWPGALVVLDLPLLFFALQLRGRRAAGAFDCTVLALGLWAAGQAGALAYARSADYGGYVSRYGELLAVLVLANALALARLWPARGRWRAAAAVFTLAWAGIVVAGHWNLSHGGHTNYFHEHAASNAQLRRDAVQAYLLHRDRSLLDRPETRAVLFQFVDRVTGVLDQPGLRAVLPASVNPENPPDPAGTLVRALQSRAGVVAGLAGAVLLAGAARSLRRSRPATELPAFPLQPEPLLPWLAAPVAIAAGAVVFHWPDPLTFGLDKRWHRFFAPPGSIGPLELHLVRGSQALPDDYLIGAAPLYPSAVRFIFSGTNPGGADFTCTAWSKPFPVTTSWLVVPHAGFPVSNGNSLRLRLEEPDGRFIIELVCPGPNPAYDPAFWTADLRAYAGRQARLVLDDGRTDYDAWVAAAPPIATNDPALGQKLARALGLERMAPAHAACAWLSMAAGLLLAAWLAGPRLSPPPTSGP